MRTVYSIVRLTVGCCAVFGGTVLLGAPGTESRWAGILVGGAGLALALHETAYIHSRFMRSRED
jgi:hypothetical protein